jgi:predicted Fe-Mo cluster-binding NifX family protein
MRVCISATGTDKASLVDPRFGRAANLLVVDTETGDVHPLDSAARSSHGAGVQAAQQVMRAGADVLLTGRIGPRAYEVLAAAEIPIYLASSTTVARAIADFIAGRLEKISGATNAPHAGMRA